MKTRLLLLGSVLIIALGLLLWSMRVQAITDEELESLGVVILPEPVELANVSLVTENGEAFHGEELQGKWTFGFFGYTHCPDICPVTLSQMKTVVETLRERGDTVTLNNIQRMFVSIDAKRDSAEAVKTYTDNIDPEILGITGDPDGVKKFAESVYVGYKQLGDPTAEKDYLVEHQGNIIIFNRDGNCYGFIKSPFEDHLLARVFKGLAQRT